MQQVEKQIDDFVEAQVKQLDANKCVLRGLDSLLSDLAQTLPAASRTDAVPLSKIFQGPMGLSVDRPARFPAVVSVV